MKTKSDVVMERRARILAAAHRLAKPGETPKFADLCRELKTEDSKPARGQLAQDICALRDKGEWPFAYERAGLRRPRTTSRLSPETEAELDVIDLTGAIGRRDGHANGKVIAPPVREPLSDMEALARLDRLFDEMSDRGRREALAYLAARFGG